MENIIKTVVEKSGISESQAKTAVEAVVSFLKDKMPAGIGAQIDTFIKGGNGAFSEAGGSIKEKMSGIIGK
ncbi:MAG: hypothetical protein V4608_12505 [Bacteroidota bacterium]